MKNIPHQFTLIDKYYAALQRIKQLIIDEVPLKDENLGEQLLQNGIINPRDKTQSIEAYLEEQNAKTPSNRGHKTAGRETIKFFKLTGFLIIYDDYSAELTTRAIQMLSVSTESNRLILWKEAFQQMGVEGIDGEISHPYRILNRLVQDKPGIETSKLMLALEAEDDSPEEYSRILSLCELDFVEILETLQISEHQARNAVKILPSLAEQVGDIVRRNNFSFPVGQVLITEDDISTQIPQEAKTENGVSYSQYRKVDSDQIAIDPTFSNIVPVSIDLTEAIRTRQNRLAHHQTIVRKLALLCEENNFELYEGKFDCLATTENNALVFEVKTILETLSDQEKQTVKGVGQLKYYDFSIVRKQMGYENTKQILVYSQKPEKSLIEFCQFENISIVWMDESENIFKIHIAESDTEINFEPKDL